MKKKVIKYINDDVLVINLRYDDECKNGHNTFSITANLYDCDFISYEVCYPNKKGNNRYLGACGCLHDEIIKHAPEFAHLIKWHLVSEHEPLHYIANSLYHAASYPPKNAWIYYQVKDTLHLADKEILLRYTDRKTAEKAEKLPGYRVQWDEKTAKESNLAAARNCAIWPEAKLSDFTELALRMRLPKLMEEFNKDMKNIFNAEN